MPVPTVGMFQHPITFSASRIGLGAMLNTPLNGPIHLQDDEDCGENRDRFKCQRHDHSGVGWLAKRPKPTDVMANHQTRNTRSVSGRPFCSILRNSSHSVCRKLMAMETTGALMVVCRSFGAKCSIWVTTASAWSPGLRSARRDASLGQMRLRPATPIDDTRCGSP